MRKENLDYPCYFRDQNTFTAMLSQKAYIQVKMLKTMTRIEHGTNIHIIEDVILKGTSITKDQFTAAYRQANERVAL